MDTSLLILILAILKFGSYLSTSWLVGYVFLTAGGGKLLLKSQPWPMRGMATYFQIGMAIGVIAVLLTLPVHVIYVAGAGVEGLKDLFWWKLVWSGADAESLRLRALALGVLLVSQMLKIFKLPDLISNLLAIAGALTLVSSFGLRGHSVTLGMMGQGALILHLLILTTWAGCLWPLYRVCDLLETANLKPLMSRFGVYAQIPILLLAVTGGYLAVRLLQSWTTLFATPSGLLLRAKLVLVCAVLILAAKHRFWLVPCLGNEATPVAKVARSIRWEMGLVGLIFLVTAFFTTTTGPGH